MTNEPIFVICTGRSGSTLLRYILDSHSLIDAPQELHLGPLIRESLRVHRLLYEEKISADELDAHIRSKVRQQIDVLLKEAVHAPIWCDKSVSSVDYMAEIMSVYPDARYVFLYRDCLDFVHSALEVSRYGFGGFWFEDFVLKNPENIVDGLVRFWCLQTEKRLTIEEEGSFKIHSVRYEDIVRDSLPTIKKLFAFLKMEFHPAQLEAMFKEFKPGKGDLKIQSYGSIKDNTGRGKEVPVKQIESATLTKMNELLERLGYATIGSDYNFQPSKDTSFKAFISDSESQIDAYLSKILEEEEVPEQLIGKKVAFSVAGMNNQVWKIDFNQSEVRKVRGNNTNGHLILRMNMDTMMSLIDKEVNISMSFREGHVDTNCTYQELNEIGKYIFG